MLAFILQMEKRNGRVESVSLKAQNNEDAVEEVRDLIDGLQVREDPAEHVRHAIMSRTEDVWTKDFSLEETRRVGLTYEEWLAGFPLPNGFRAWKRTWLCWDQSMELDIAIHIFKRGEW